MEADLGLRVKPRGMGIKSGPEQPVIHTRFLGSLGGFSRRPGKYNGKWNGVARTPLVKKMIYDTSWLVGYIRIEATQLAEYHIRRCFQENTAIADLSYNKFWYHICLLTRQILFCDGIKADTKAPPKIIESAKEYFDITHRPDMQKVSWSENNTPSWRDGCLEAAARQLAENFEVMNSYAVYWTKVEGIVGQFLFQMHEFPSNVNGAMRTAVMACLKRSLQLSVVREAFTKTLKPLPDDVIVAVQREIIDPIAQNICGDTTKNGGALRLRSMYDLIKLLEVTFPPKNNGEMPMETETVPVTSLPTYSALTETLADEILMLPTESSSKQHVLLVRKALDVMRMTHSTLVEPKDVNLRNPKNTVSRKSCVMKLLVDGVFDNGFARFETQAHSKLLTEEEKLWIDETVKKWRYPAASGELSSYFKKLSSYIRGLRPWKPVVRKQRVKNDKPDIKIPPLCLVASKEAVTVAITGSHVKKMAAAIIKEFSAATQIEISEAKKAAAKAKNDSDKYEIAIGIKQPPKKVYKKRKQSGGEPIADPLPVEQPQPIEPPKLTDEQSNELTRLKEALDESNLIYEEVCWRALFKIKLSGGLNFGGRLTSDGISTHVSIWRRKTDEELRVEQLKNTVKFSKKEGQGLTVEEKELKKEEEAKKLASLERARFILSQPGHRPFRVFDPGASGHEGIIYDQEAHDTLDMPHGQNKHFERISLRKTVMNNKAGISYRIRAMKEWSDQNEAFTRFTEKAPQKTKCPSTGRSYTASEYIEHYVNPTNAHLGGVYEFKTQNCVRRLKFNVNVRRKAMLEDAVAQICGTNDPKLQAETVVVFGNASVNSGKTKCSRICHRELLDLLKVKCCLVMEDEFRSSKLCFCCHHELKPATTPGITSKSGESWKVRFCPHKECPRTYIQRDLNADINICNFFLWRLHDVEFPVEFTRGRKKPGELGDSDSDIDGNEQAIPALCV